MNIPNEEVADLEKSLIKRGYKRIAGHYKKEDWGYWKSFDITRDKCGDEEAGYQIAVLFYNWNKFDHISNFPLANKTGIQFEAITSKVPEYERIDISSSGDEVTIEKWEEDVKKVIDIMTRNKITIDTNA